MTAAARLWRRAPLWRLSLGASLTFAALTALYPSRPLERVLSSLIPHRSSTDAVRVVETSMVPIHRTLVPLAGRSLPLPAGDWREVLAGRFEPGAEVSELVLVRLQHGRLTGLIDAVATTGPAAGLPGLPQACLDPTNEAAGEPSGLPAASHECWLVRQTPVPTPTQGDDPRTMLDAARERLRRLGVDTPPSLTRAAWFRTGNHEFMSVIVDLPAIRADRVAAWLKGWIPTLDRGFEGTLRSDRVTARLARDPAAP